VLLVRKDLKDSGRVRTVADLKGAKVGIAGGAGTAGAYFVAKALKESGLGIKDIEVVNLANPDLPLAIEKGAIDCALTGSPYSDQILAGGKAVILAQDFAPKAMTTVFMYSGKFMKERTSAARRFMVALVKGVRAMAGAGYLDPANMKAYLKYVASTEDSIRKGKPNLYDPDLQIHADSLINMEEVFRWAGWATYNKVIPQSQMVDTSFQGYAVKTLGPYKP
jgi:ABC-type nitrate/sulfonate/bicarbonate transport system substrate-binding protein